MQSEAYAQKVKISNLQQMAETLIYVQEHEYGHREEVTAALEHSRKDLEISIAQSKECSSQMKTLNSQIHYITASKRKFEDRDKFPERKNPAGKSFCQRTGSCSA